MLDTFIRNWKTSLVGLAVLGVTVAFLLGRITMEQFLMGFGVLTGSGLLVAKDGKAQQ